MNSAASASRHVSPQTSSASGAPEGPEAGRIPARGAGPLPDAGDSQESASLLTEAVHEAVGQAGLLHTLLEKHVVADGPSRDDDLAELRAAIHVIRRTLPGSRTGLPEGVPPARRGRGDGCEHAGTAAVMTGTRQAQPPAAAPQQPPS